MDDDRKKRLIDLGTETLAEALLELASRNNAADDLVERLIATPLENIQRFKTKLAAIKRSRRFIRWGEAAGFARELQDLLHELEFSVSDPEQGAEWVAAFYLPEPCIRTLTSRIQDAADQKKDDAKSPFIAHFLILKSPF